MTPSTDVAADGRLLVLNRIPHEVTPLAEWLGPAAARTTLITSQDAAPGYRTSFDQVIDVEDYTHGDEVEDRAAALLAAGGFGAVVHLIEDDVLRAARLRDAFGLLGLRHADVVPYRDKYPMKVAVAAAGIPCPAFTAPTDDGDAERFARTHGWPVVVKPRLGSGSQGVTFVHDADTLRRVVRARPAGDVLVEQCVPGPVHHVDGLMHDGRIHFAVASRYVNDCLAFHDARPLGSAQLDPDSAEAVALLAFAHRVVAALPPVDFSPFHLEVFRHRDTGELVFCEIACRMGGAHVMETLTYAAGRNLAALHVQHQAGLRHGPDVPLRPDHRRYGWIILPPREGTLMAVRRPPPVGWLKDFVVKTALPRGFGPARWSTDSYLGAVVQGLDHAEVVAHLDQVAAMAEELTTWR